MKSFTLFALLAVMLVCMLGQQQQANASFWGDIKHDADDVGHDVVKAGDDTANVAEEGVHDIEHDAPAIDKVANEVEPVAKVVATGVEIGETL